MSTKEQIINNLREYDTGQIAQYIREGKFSLYELSKSGQLTPLMRKRIEERFGSLAEGSPAESQPTVQSTQDETHIGESRLIRTEVATSEVQSDRTARSEASAFEAKLERVELPALADASKNSAKNIIIQDMKKPAAENPAEEPADFVATYANEPAAVYVQTSEETISQPWTPHEDSTEAYSQPPMFDNRGMWKRPFSFKGRIRRTEYGLTYLITYILYSILMFLSVAADSGIVWIITWLIYIVFIWLLYAQGAKRCHDLGHSGWFQIIPFYFFVMLFANGEKGCNKYGNNPKNQ